MGLYYVYQLVLEKHLGGRMAIETILKDMNHIKPRYYGGSLVT